MLLGPPAEMLTLFRRINRDLFDAVAKLKRNVCRVSYYHCQTGVYGYKPKVKQSFAVNHAVIQARNNNPKVYQLIESYRQHGHKISNLNPTEVDTIGERYIPELDILNHGLNLTDMCTFTGLLNHEPSTTNVEELVKALTKIYCDKISVEFSYLEDLEEREWFASSVEQLPRECISDEEKKALLAELIKSQAFDRFLALKYVSLKRYGGEGAESSLGVFLELFKLAAEDGVTNIVIGSHHRGRLNLLIGLLKMRPELLFRKLQGKAEFGDDYHGIGDVISHLCPSAQLNINGKTVNVSTTNLPSHLEAVCPVSLGIARGLQQTLKEADYSPQTEGNWGDKVMNVQVHGDGALMGQGVSHESLVMSTLPHFNVGGTIHLVINNQLGFTTPPAYGRGTRYASDIAKVTSAPVIHVNGDSPEDVLKASRLAIRYQRKFRKNVFIDLNCYRQWGHNELDDPTFTNPLIYSLIRSKKTVPDMYSDSLIKESLVTSEAVSEISQKHLTYLNNCLKNVDSFSPQFNFFPGEWAGYSQAPNAITVWETGVDKQILLTVGAKSVCHPENFNVHAGLLKNHIKNRLAKLREGSNLDWATAEALAFGSLLYQGYNVRLCGQDVGRGTFSQRHAMIVDQQTDDVYIPLNNISPYQQGFLEIANSFLSEEAVLGFEYGFSSVSPKNLVIWEAQFGDFFNGAQIQIDTYITSGEAKWITMSGLVMILPHGYDGAGPEHSSARMERFLQLSDSSESRPDGEDVNIHIVNPTTPAQYFHLLRRQLVRNYRKPLIIFGPKILIRSPDAVSSIDEMTPGKTFHPVLGDSSPVDKNRVQRVIFVSGKHYYALTKYREEIQADNVAIIRVEELCPFPTYQIREELSKYKNVKDIVWSQEEPQNMGAWSYCKQRFENLVGHKIRFTGREPSPAPAVGIGELHKREAERVIKDPFEPFKK